MMKIHRKAIFYPSLLLAVCLPASASSDLSQDKQQRPRIDFMLEGGVHLLNGQFDWNIASDSSGNVTPDVANQQKYKNLEASGSNFHTALAYNFGKSSSLVVDFEAFSSTMDSGSLSDRYYSADDKTNETSRSSARIKDDDIKGNQFALGYRSAFAVTNKMLYTWYLGYSDQEQNFTFSDGYQGDTSTGMPAIGEGSSYSAQWDGPWLGLELSQSAGAHTVTLSYQHFEVDFEADGQWLQVPTAYQQKADGEAGRAHIEYLYAFNKHLVLGAVYNWNRYLAKDGSYTLEGQAPVLLNEVNWEYYTISLNIRLKL